MADRIVEDIFRRERTEEKLRRQQAELRALFDFIPAMICFKDTENRLLRANQRLADRVGKTVAEIEGKPMHEILPREAAGFYEDDLEVIHSRVAKLGIIEKFHDREGKELWIQTDKVPVFDNDGKVMGLVVMGQDITERKRIEASLRESNEKFLQLANNITDAFWIRSPDMREVHYVSPAFERIWGDRWQACMPIRIDGSNTLCQRIGSVCSRPSRRCWGTRPLWTSNIVLSDPRARFGGFVSGVFRSGTPRIC